MMKKLIILTCMLQIAFSGSATTTKAKEPIHVLSTRMDVFYFKVDKEFLGAEIEIFSMEGEKLVSQIITHRRVLLDFYFETPGKFFIRVNKNGAHKEYNFTKERNCPDGGTPTVTIIQGV